MTLAPPKQRILSIDILRGAIMLIMAIDHVRDMFHIHAIDDDPTNLATTTPLLFFTRWITHFCAPNFLFLSGISAFIAGKRKTGKEQSVFLLKRGLWLVVVEVVVITLGITFNPLYNVIILQVIWAIGISMILLGLLLMARASVTAILVIGCILFFGHNIIDYITLPKDGAGSVLLNILIASPRVLIPIGPNRFIFDLYTILPWTSAMLIGYAIGSLFVSAEDAVNRRRILFITGLGITILFFALRLINQYGDPSPWATQKTTTLTIISFFNVTKYPASLQYLCMTIGPCMILLSFLENVKSWFSQLLIVYGRVPFFYYVIHFYLLHFLLVIVFFASSYGIKDIVDPQIPFLFRPMHFGFGLGGVYLIWLIVIAILYQPCKWFYNYKATHKQWWLKYV
ncbi:MAG: heparan-alpha-glucosaminide N-acetyltransferase domain-containing protein [Chitinophagaceae bacterium]